MLNRYILKMRLEANSTVILLRWRSKEFWETQSTCIDRELVKLRNDIAHGEMRPVTRATYRALRGFIRTALGLFKRSLEEAALNKVYLKATTENIG